MYIYTTIEVPDWLWLYIAEGWMVKKKKIGVLSSFGFGPSIGVELRSGDARFVVILVVGRFQQAQWSPLLKQTKQRTGTGTTVVPN